MISRFHSEEAALEAAALEAYAVEAGEANVDAVASVADVPPWAVPIEELPEEHHPFPEGTSSRGTSSLGVPQRGSSSVGVGEAWRYARRLGLPGPTRQHVALCARRIESERGLRTLPDVPAGELPAGTPEAVERVWRGFLLLVACRWADYPGATVVFARSFASCWCGVSEDVAWRAVLRLHADGLMRRVRKAGRSWEWLPAAPDTSTERTDER